MNSDYQEKWYFFGLKKLLSIISEAQLRKICMHVCRGCLVKLFEMLDKNFAHGDDANVSNGLLM